MSRLPSLLSQPVHLGLGARAVIEPPFTGADWYRSYEERHGDDGAEGRLVAIHSFSESWTSWEMHPVGDELVVCLAGEIALIQEHPDGRRTTLVLGPYDYAINPPGVWHTADVADTATALFVTAGAGTEVRPR